MKEVGAAWILYARNWTSKSSGPKDEYRGKYGDSVFLTYECIGKGLKK